MSFPVLFDRPRKKASSFFLIKDDFLTADAAPLITPAPAEPGPGTRTVIQPTNGLNISGGLLNGVSVGGSAGDTTLTYEALNLKAGLAYLFRFTAVAAATAVFPSINDGGNLSPRVEMAVNSTVGIREKAGGGAVGGIFPVPTVPFTIWMIRRASGGIYWGVNSTLVWVGSVLVTTSLSARLQKRTPSLTFSAEYVRVADLVLKYPIWGGDFGIATNSFSGTVSPGQAFTHEADFMLTWTQTTLPTAGILDFRFRVQDASNYWQVTVSSVGLITLTEVVAGVPTVRTTNAGGTVGSRLCMRVVGANIECWRTLSDVTSLLFTYGSSPTFLTETDGSYESAGTGGVVTDLATWPRTLSGNALAALTEAQA